VTLPPVPLRLCDGRGRFWRARLSAGQSHGLARKLPGCRGRSAHTAGSPGRPIPPWPILEDARCPVEDANVAQLIKAAFLAKPLHHPISQSNRANDIAERMVLFIEPTVSHIDAPSESTSGTDRLCLLSALARILCRSPVVFFTVVPTSGLCFCRLGGGSGLRAGTCQINGAKGIFTQMVV
jgi:hypothetical protein